MDVPALDGHATQKPKVTTAFIVVLKDGNTGFTGDLNTPIELEREPTIDDVVSMCRQVDRNLLIQQISAAVAGGMMQLGQQVAQAQQNAELAKKLRLK